MTPLLRSAVATRRVLVFVVLSAVAGLLVGGLVLPVAGGVGLLARASSEQFQDLPSDFEETPLPQTTRMLTADGKLIARFYDQDRKVVSLDQVSKRMKQAQLAIEDSRFYEHGGADLRGLARAALNNASGGGTQGASTLTQQYVKLALVYKARQEGDEEAERAATEETVGRKLRELRYAVALEEKYSKDEIFERYLNIAYYGAGAYGIETAANRYFSKPASKLTLEESALLAGLVQRPNATSPDKKENRDAAIERRNVVLNRMAELGMISQTAAARAKAKKLVLKESNQRLDCEQASKPYQFFCDYAKSVFLNDKRFGSTYQARYNRLYGGGLTIRTTLDSRMQNAALDAVHEWVDREDPVAGVVAMVEPGTGDVKSIAISKDYGRGPGRTKVNLALGAPLGASKGTLAGSTFKIFVTAAALEKGYGFYHSIYSPAQLRSVRSMETCDGSAYDPGWQPKNESASENGSYTLERALEDSVNTYFVQLEEQIGLCEPVTLAEKMGVLRADTGEKLQQVQSFTLGTNNVAPLNMAAAYATFGARGKYCPAWPVSDIDDPKRPNFEYPRPECKQVLDEEVADAVNYLAERVVDSGTGTAANISGRDVAGKTGTTNGKQQAWFMGYTPEIAAASVVWNPSPPRGGYSLTGKTIGGQYYYDVFGGSLPAPMWQDAVGAALDAVDAPSTDFVRPQGKFFSGGSYSSSYRHRSGNSWSSSGNSWSGSGDDEDE
ncbi:transglycosylase domain-containing protein [Motilibacter aurantiacus]|uniref:transglycosylase domain-containing protein n=1 Tax=Motilibacter aurantiacus TaxID=2714955 RepID=UPI00140DEDDF|nr:transglycosylase domain-containing protein [Motilibacter aurantiacus]NHC44395.1 penicillin-binding protein [Motilibacter aurantiacus]